MASREIVQLQHRAERALEDLELRVRRLGVELLVTAGELPDVDAQLDELQGLLDVVRAQVGAYVDACLSAEVVELQQAARAAGVADEEGFVAERLSEREEADRRLLGRLRGQSPAPVPLQGA